ncbi:hypothetical protein SAMN04490248_12226 [Salinihabitans flavidus]|uniref:Uncharacterized protein n=1 Tax=Salinihabitans flavidus TaxID=569882 RepID=A0A1H8UT81_9RHOB|nr:hypothetical protein [Salinihabitans flavidus]SEP06430.1 hypothetical protein SAMN04490248_12226 [Salinihabitans flavidus]
MTAFTLTKTRLFEGVWEGVLHAREDSPLRPDIEVTHLEKPITGVQVKETPDGEGWQLRVPVPVEVIRDGVQTFLIRDKTAGETLESFTLISGEALADDIRAEMELLRAELDMLKRAFRRHCLETM